jgi:high-affinity nickel-transport protein
LARFLGNGFDRRRIRDDLDRRQVRTVAVMAAAVLGLHGLGLFLLFAVASRHHLGSSGGLAVGTGVTAYTLGLRHAFDADHVSAIDNTARKLMADGKRPTSVGFFFSLGHSTVVFALVLLLALGAKTLGGSVKNPGSTLHGVANWVGTGVSATFLYLIAALNIAILLGILKVFRDMRTGRYSEEELERRLQSRGLMNRFFGRFSSAITKPRHMYPLGLLFGLGFDTASEVALLFLAAGAAGAGLPFYAILCLPILFAAGMSLLDTIDGSFMTFAYEWAFSRPVRKVFYNIVITGLSVAVALMIGTIELTVLLAQKLGAQGSFWTWLEHLDSGTLGFMIVAMFAITWAIAGAVWRLGRIEDRWSARRAESEAAG